MHCSCQDLLCGVRVHLHGTWQGVALQLCPVPCCTCLHVHMCAGVWQGVSICQGLLLLDSMFDTSTSHVVQAACSIHVAVCSSGVVWSSSGVAHELAPLCIIAQSCRLY